MKISSYSEIKKEWVRVGDKIEYSVSDYKQYCKGKAKKCFSLSFIYTFENDNDTVWFAYSQPYTYTDLQNYLKSIERDHYKSKYFTREMLCSTIGGFRCDLLIITSPGNKTKNKQGVVLTSRVHPGETVGSWMMKGAIDFLLSEEKEAVALRNLYVFKIVPMLNPDGVIQGNYRTSLVGHDLNRRYTTPSKVRKTHIINSQCIHQFIASKV